MTTSSRDHRTKAELREENEQLRDRLDEAEQTLNAIRSGDVDALVVSGPQGDQIFSLTGAERTYRLIIETMNEAALTVDLAGTILFCNQRFAGLAKCAIAEIVGRKLTAFVGPSQQSLLQKLMADAQAGPTQRSLALRAADGGVVSVQLAASALVDAGNTSICLVASDLTELEGQADSIRVLLAHQRALEESKTELQAANVALLQSRLAALNVSEDAIAARRQAEELSSQLLREATERKQAEEALKESEQLFRVLFQNLQSAVALVNEHGEFTIINQSFLRVFDLADDSNIKNVNDRDWSQWQVFDEQGALLDVDEHPVRKVALTGRPVRDQLVAVKAPENPNFKWLLVSAEPLLDDHGHVHRLICTYHDITEHKQAEEEIKTALAEKEAMLKEIHHRVKNNLQVISSLISLQSDHLTDERLRDEFNDVRNRVSSMALIHEKLYQAGDLARLNFADYATSLLSSLWHSHSTLAEQVRLILALTPVALSIEAAVPCGLILNELAGNALKHAFPHSCAGEVTVGLEHDATTGTVCLRVHDNGVGLPEGLDWRQSRSLGLRLVQILAGQLGGTLEAGPGPGTEFRIVFPATTRRRQQPPSSAIARPVLVHSMVPC